MKRILIVDDKLEIRDLVAETFDTGEYVTLTACNGEEAVETVRSEKPDLVFMDIMMPGAIDGFEATRILKSDPSTKDIPIIMLTAGGQLADQQKGFKVGADGFFTKPFSPIELHRKVEEYLGT